MEFGDLWTSGQAALVEILVKAWTEDHRWPIYAYVADEIEKLGFDAFEVLRSFPTLDEDSMGSWRYADVFYEHNYLPSETSQVGLTVAGLARHNACKPYAAMFVNVLAWAAAERAKTPTSKSQVVELSLSVAQAREVLTPNLLLLLRTFLDLLDHEPIRGVQALNRSAKTREWIINVGREVTRYKDLTVERYLDILRKDLAPPSAAENQATRTAPRTDELGVPAVSWDGSLLLSQPQSTSHVAAGPDGSNGGNSVVGTKMFISHAYADKAIADSLRDHLVLAGIPNERIFFSSARTTGIPAGTEIRTHLRVELQDAAIVIELLSANFIDRPMCLMELGAAWALGKSTLPIVLPPLTLDEARATIGDVLMLSFQDAATVADVFAEIGDRAATSMGLTLGQSRCMEAGRKFALTYQTLAASAAQPIASPAPTAKVGPLRFIPVPQFLLQHVGGAEYRLRNVSEGPLTGVAFQVPDDYQVSGYEAAVKVDLARGQSYTFMMNPDSVDQLPSLGELEVTCNESEGSIYVPIPP